MKFYIAGPMAGYPGFNHEAFNHAERVLLERGFEVVNPAALNHQDPRNHSGDFATGRDVTSGARAEFLRRDFRYLSQCDAIILLDGWADSTGANCELLASLIMGLSIYVFTMSGIEIPTPWLLPDMEKVAGHVRNVARLKIELQKFEEHDEDYLGRTRMTYTGM